MGGIGCSGYVVLAVVLVLSIAYWYISVPIVVLTAIAVGVTVHRHHVQRERAPTLVQPQVPRPARTPPLTMPADTFKVGSLVHLEKDGTRATYFVDHGRTPDEIVLKRVTSTPSVPDA
jgi:hypothetical protein